MVVLVHGFAASADDPAVVRQAEALHAAGFDVLCYDSRGHGDSDGLCTIGDLESHDVAAAVAAVAAVVGSRDVPVIVLGASIGAIAALRFAATTKERRLAWSASAARAAGDHLAPLAACSPPP